MRWAGWARVRGGDLLERPSVLGPLRCPSGADWTANSAAALNRLPLFRDTCELSPALCGPSAERKLAAVVALVTDPSLFAAPLLSPVDPGPTRPAFPVYTTQCAVDPMFSPFLLEPPFDELTHGGGP